MTQVGHKNTQKNANWMLEFEPSRKKKRTIEKKSDCEIANKRHDSSANACKNANWAHKIQAKDPF